MEAEKSNEAAVEIRHDRERRTRRINEMLCYRIYKRNQTLPLNRQVLGASYGASGDSMNIAVEFKKKSRRCHSVGRICAPEPFNIQAPPSLWGGSRSGGDG